jgi:hypothetical protein
MITTICILIYLICAWAAYKYVISKWSQPKWEKVMLSLAWILMLPLYGINKLNDIGRK